MALPLFRFLYLDSPLTNEFLGQLEGGLYTEEEQTLKGADSKSIGGSVGTGGIGLKGGKTKADEEAVSKTVRQTPESSFARLHRALTDAEAIQWLEALDDEIWNQLRRGEIVEVEASITVSSLKKYADLATQITPLVKVMESFGEGLDAETESALAGMASLGQLTDKVPIVAASAGASKYKFIASLEPSNVRVELGELEGEATLLAKIQRKLRAGENYTLFDSIPGLGQLPREVRRDMERELSEDENEAFPDAVIRPPAAVVTAIALYR